MCGQVKVVENGGLLHARFQKSCRSEVWERRRGGESLLGAGTEDLEVLASGDGGVCGNHVVCVPGLCLNSDQSSQPRKGKFTIGNDVNRHQLDLSPPLIQIKKKINEFYKRLYEINELTNLAKGILLSKESSIPTASTKKPN